MFVLYNSAKRQQETGRPHRKLESTQFRRVLAELIVLSGAGGLKRGALTPSIPQGLVCDVSVRLLSCSVQRVGLISPLALLTVA